MAKKTLEIHPSAHVQILKDTLDVLLVIEEPSTEVINQIGKIQLHLEALDPTMFLPPDTTFTR